MVWLEGVVLGFVVLRKSSAARAALDLIGAKSVKANTRESVYSLKGSQPCGVPVGIITDLLGQTRP